MTIKKRRVQDASSIETDKRKALEKLVFGKCIGESSDEDDIKINNEQHVHVDILSNDVKMESEDLIKNSIETTNDLKDLTNQSLKLYSSNDNVCAWHDSDDDDINEGTINISTIPKLKKLKNFGDSTNSNLTASELHTRLQDYHLKKNQSESWINRLRELANTDADNLLSDDNSIHLKTSEIKLKPSLKVSKFLKTSVNILGTTGDAGCFPPTKLDYRLLPDLNRASPSESKVISCGFIPGTTKFFTAGRDKTIRLFQTDTQDNTKIASFHIKSKCIKSAVAVSNSNHPIILFIGGERSVGVLDINTNSVSMCRSLTAARRDQRLFHLSHGPTNQFAVTADNAHILCCDIRMRSVAQDFKMNAESRAITFLPNEEGRLFSGDSEGTIYEWDMAAGRCIRTFHDEGSQSVTSLASISTPSSSCYLAAGSTSGYVNIYDIRRHHSIMNTRPNTTKQSTSFFDMEENTRFGTDLLEYHTESQSVLHSSTTTNIKPIKSLGHLTTSVSSLAFHPSACLLAMASSETRESLKLVHAPTFTVFSNFPRQDSSLNLKYVECIGFNESGSSMVLGNSHGLVKHIRLGYFVTTSERKRWSSKARAT